LITVLFYFSFFFRFSLFFQEWGGAIASVSPIPMDPPLIDPFKYMVDACISRASNLFVATPESPKYENHQLATLLV
jgi:hypothetical protein